MPSSPMPSSLKSHPSQSAPSGPALLFDLDGTLADTNPDLHHTMNVILERLGHQPVPMDRVRHMIGGGARKILERGLSENGVTLDDRALDQATEDFVLYYDQHIDQHTQIFEGVVSLLERAQAAGIALAVVTNKRESLAAKLLFRLKLHPYFPVLVGGDTLPKRKPDADPIIHALSQLNADPNKSVMIGDSEADTASARAAGIACVCVSFGYRRVSLEALGADRIIDHFNELAEALAQIRPGVFTL